jgi:hypothetical protein
LRIAVSTTARSFWTPWPSPRATIARQNMLLPVGPRQAALERDRLLSSAVDDI